jgi:plasmid rolling circle replication initiator protein Rep
MSRSRIAEQLHLIEVRRNSSLTFAAALKTAATTMLPFTRERTEIVKHARRITTCNHVGYQRVVTLPKQASFISRTNKRACASRFCLGCEADASNEHFNELVADLDCMRRKQPDVRFIMVNLTSRDRPVGEAAAMLRDHRAALKRFWAYERITEATLGHVTAIEATFPAHEGKIFAHVHSHSLVAIHANALSDHRYIPINSWRRMWKRALKADYEPIVWVSNVAGPDGETDLASIRNAAREVLKYAVDPSTHVDDLHVFRVVPAVALASFRAFRRVHRVTSDRLFKATRKERRLMERQQAPDAKNIDEFSGAAGS